jgi:hypothetical protein
MADLDQPPGFWAKFRRLFSRRRAPEAATHSIVPATRSIFHPWRRYDPAIVQLQKDYDTLMQLMLALRDHLDQQSHQQQELSQQLVKLSETDSDLPANTRTPDEAVRAIAQQMAYQSQQQNRIGNILEKLSDASGQQGRAMQGLTDRLEAIEHHGQLIGENMQSMGIVVQSVNRNSEQNAQSLSAIHQHLEHHGQMHVLAHRQTERLTILAIITLALAAAALIAVIVIGAMLAHRQRTSQAVPTTQVMNSPIRASAPSYKQ